jgi:hypothetical protein
MRANRPGYLGIAEWLRRERGAVQCHQKCGNQYM